MSFVIRGITRDGRSAAVEWFHPNERRRTKGQHRGLVGDEEVIRAAVLAEARGSHFAATPTGPEIVGDLDDANAALLLLGSLFVTGFLLDGDPQRASYPVPYGAIP